MRKKLRKQVRKFSAKPLRDPAIQIQRNQITPNLVKPKDKNQFQTLRYSQQIPLKENNKI